MSTPICTFIPKGAYAGGDLPKWIYGIVQTLVNKPGPQSKLYLKKGLQYGTTVPDMLWVFSEGAWEDAARDGEDHERDPVLEAHHRDGSRRVQGLPRPDHPGPAEVACGKVSKAEPAACGNQTKFYNYLGKGKWKLVVELAEAARSEVDVRTETTAGPAVAGPAGSADD